MKKVFLSFLFLSLALSLAACGSPAITQTPANVSSEIADTGKVTDVSAMNGQTVNAVPGDVLYLKLSSKTDKNKQWSVASTTDVENLILKDHKVAGLDSATTTSEWWPKIAKSGPVKLQFDYGQFQKKVEYTFKIDIAVSQ